MKEFQSHYSPSKYNIKNGSDNSNKIRRSPIEKKVQKKQEKYTQELKLREIYLAKKDRYETLMTQKFTPLIWPN